MKQIKSCKNLKNKIFELFLPNILCISEFPKLHPTKVESRLFLLQIICNQYLDVSVSLFLKQFFF